MSSRAASPRYGYRCKTATLRISRSRLRGHRSFYRLGVLRQNELVSPTDHETQPRTRLIPMIVAAIGIVAYVFIFILCRLETIADPPAT
jgi:hypothetical protein